MNKKIITIAEIVFALVFVVMLAVFMATINSKGNDANNQLVTTLEATTGTSLSSYDNLDVVKGTVVENAVKSYDTLSSSAKVTVAVKTQASTGWALYGYDKDGNTHPAYNAKNTQDWYINPKADFVVKVIRNTNDVAVGVAFEQRDSNNKPESMADGTVNTVTGYITGTQNVKSSTAGHPTIVGGGSGT